jgi:hypothetical protein
MKPLDPLSAFVADNLTGAVRLEVLDAAGNVLHVVGQGAGAVGAPRAEASDIGQGWRLRLYDAAGHLLADLPTPSAQIAEALAAGLAARYLQ